jgi:hypothetical protein
MSNRLDSAIPPKIQRVATAMRRFGWLSFWCQLILGIFSAVSLASASLTVNRAVQPQIVNGQQVVARNSGTGPGIFLSVCGLVALFLGAYWAFSYVKLSRRLQRVDTANRPKKVDAIRAIQLGIAVSFIGMLLAILAAQAIVGPLVLKSLNQGFVMFTGQLPQLIGTPDILAVQANTNIIMAHFIGAIASIWLLMRTNSQ